ncbi:MAG: hypothetical protein IJ386_07365 [Clostridia bacterium]|nr:hypothetical protein [Clostridia bacterium]
MFIKLLKYELKDVLKIVWIFYSIALFFAVLTRILLALDGSTIVEIIGKICSGITVSMIFNIVINNVMRLWGRFRQSLYGDESYLRHTLPVTKSEQYLSRFANAAITMAISVAVIVGVMFVAYYSKDNLEVLRMMLFPMAEAYDCSIGTILATAVIVIFLEVLHMIQCGFCGIILGHRMNSAKLGMSVMFGLAIYMVTQIAVLISIVVTGLFSPEIMDIVMSNGAVTPFAVKILLAVAVAVYTVMILVGCAVNVKLLRRGVDVD